MKGIPLSEINPQLLLEAGIVNDKIDSKVIALSRVLDALRSCSYADSVWALEHSQMLLKGEEATPQDYGHVVIEIVSQVFGFGAVDLEGKSRSADLSLARQVVMYILWRSEKYTLGHIGQLLGDRTPATISHGFQSVATKMAKDSKLQSVVEKLLRELE